MYYVYSYLEQWPNKHRTIGLTVLYSSARAFHGNSVSKRICAVILNIEYSLNFSLTKVIA